MIEQLRQQMKFMREAATKAAISGKLYIDVDPEDCFLRLKVVELTNLDPTVLINMLCSALVRVGQSLNLEVRTHVRQTDRNE